MRLELENVGLREVAAVAAMNGLLAGRGGEDADPAAVAEYAVRQADELVARLRGEEVRP